jgi:PAS domain S-box-containing protein
MQTMLEFYGLAFFAMGLAIGVRALPHPRSLVRWRVLSLAAFGLVHAIFEWLQIPSDVALAVGGMRTGLAVAALSFVPLFFFAVSRNVGRAPLALAVMGVSGGAWIIADLSFADPVALELFTRLAVGLPALLAAAHAFWFDRGLVQSEDRLATLAARLAALAFLILGMLQLFSSPAAFALASILNTQRFEEWFGVPCFAVRATTALFLSGAVLALLGRFDAGMRRHSEEGRSELNQALAASEARLRAILDSSPDCVKTVDAECRLLDMNAVGLAMIEAGSLEEVKGKCVLELIGPDFRTMYQEGVAAVFSGTPTQQQYEIVGLKGTRRWLEQRAVPLQKSDDPRHVRAMLAVTRDVTERVRAEEALRTTATRLRGAQRIAKLGSWELDLTGNTAVFSDEVYRILENDPASFGATYEALLDTVHHDDRAAVDRAYKDSLANKTAVEFDFRVPMRDGRVKWLRVRSETQSDDEGRAIISRGTVQDITERKTTEDALRQSEATLATFLKVSPEAVIVTDDKMRITVFSSGAEAIFGYAADEVIGREVECLMPVQMRDLHGKHIQAFRESHVTGQMMGERSEIVGRRKDGEEFPAEASLSKLKTPLGMYFAAVLRDISSQKATLRDLLAAKRAAEGASEAKSRFIANMSHELRTPLNAIIGFSELMMGQCFGALGDPRYREYAADIRKSGEHLLSLINEILDISRIEAGSIELNEEAPLEIEELIDHCTRWVTARAADTGVALRTEIAPETPALRGDPRLLTQILLNLISNALKFTPAGGLVKVRAGLATSGGVEIAVADTGIGMSPQQLERIGEPFLQFDDDKGRRGEGTGLGVSIAKRLAELHGGELSIDSAAGRGTIATLRLPKARSIARLLPRPAALAS